MVYSLIAAANYLPSAVMAAGAANSSTQQLLDVPQAQTWAGQNSQSMAGYMGRRFLAGLNPFAEARGVSLYRYDLERIPGRFQYQHLPASEDTDQLSEFHASLHGDRLSWADGLTAARLDLHGSEGRIAHGTSYENLLELNRESRVIWREMIEDWEHGPDDNNLHERNMRISHGARDRWSRLKQILVRAEEIEYSWQVAAYKDLMTVAQESAVSPSRGEIKRFTEALQNYETRMQAYIEYDRLMSQDDPKSREHRRKKVEEKAFVALRDLHETVQKIYRRIGHQGVEALGAPLTFLWKTQAHLIGKGPNGMAALEPLLEMTWNLRKVVSLAKKGFVPPEKLDELAATLFGVNLLSWQFRSLRLGFPEGFPVFSHHRPPEAGLIDGLSTFVQGENSVGRGIISHWTHTGAIDYAGVTGGLYLLGLNPPSILAEKAFKFIPTMAGYLTMRGVFLDRSKGMDAIYEAMVARLEQGLNVAIFGTGTRGIDYPLVSPYADTNPRGALHLPGEYYPSRDMTGMHVKLAMMTGSDIDVFATNLHRGGVPVPDIPRKPKGFLGRHNNFHLARVGEEDGFVALAGRLPYHSLIQEKDFPGESRIGVIRRNVDIIREMEMMAGRRMDTGLNG